MMTCNEAKRFLDAADTVYYIDAIHEGSSYSVVFATGGYRKLALTDSEPKATALMLMCRKEYPQATFILRASSFSEWRKRHKKKKKATVPFKARATEGR